MRIDEVLEFEEDRAAEAVHTGELLNKCVLVIGR
jgi:hypothetical protein